MGSEDKVDKRNRYKCTCGYGADDYSYFLLHATIEEYAEHVREDEYVEVKVRMPDELYRVLKWLSSVSGVTVDQVVSFFCDTYVFNMPETEPIRKQRREETRGASVY
ncbi:MAG: hypothetical protein QW734_08505 [Candidatus Bathyarchaeia archaeon]